jgi:hypothetical protein
LDTPSRTGLANTPTGKQPSAGQKLLYSTYDKGEEPPSLRLIDVWVGGAFEALQDAVPDGARVLHLLQEHDVVVIRAWWEIKWSGGSWMDSYWGAVIMGL